MKEIECRPYAERTVANMPRTHDDSWDLSSSVGATATMVAAARAVATKDDDPLINDPFAEPLVRAVGVEFFVRLIDGEFTATDGDEGPWGMSRMHESMAVRTRYFDDFFAAAVDAGIRQAVILASGLDARAYRLDWPAGTVVFEIDQPEVMEFKSRTLADLGAAPTADRRAVGIDLRQDWPKALCDAGFDPGKPTAWIAEGLLGYLPADAQDLLLDNITALSVAGSRLATESVPNLAFLNDEDVQKQMQSFTQSWRERGFGIDMSELVYLGERHEPAQYLDERGWDSTSSTAAELFAANAIAPLDDGGDPMQAQLMNVCYVTSVRN